MRRPPPVLPIFLAYGGLVLVLVGSYAFLERVMLHPHCRSACLPAELVTIAQAPEGGAACFCADERTIPTRLPVLVPILAVAITGVVAGAAALFWRARRSRLRR